MCDALPPSPAGLPHRGFTCQACGRLVVSDVDGLFHDPEHGSPQRFCGLAHCRRKAAVIENSPRQPSGGRDRKLATTRDQPPQPDLEPPATGG